MRLLGSGVDNKLPSTSESTSQQLSDQRYTIDRIDIMHDLMREERLPIYQPSCHCPEVEWKLVLSSFRYIHNIFFNFFLLMKRVIKYSITVE